MDALVTDIKNKLNDIGVFNWVAIWNNQLERVKGADLYAVKNPSAYVELETIDNHQLLEGYQGYDININIHIISEELDAGDGTIDDQISIYALRDNVVRIFSLYNANQGGFMQKINEYQDYDHTNLYHYVVQYKMHYIDDTAVIKPLTYTGITFQTAITIIK
jgi:hypothetical protein